MIVSPCISICKTDPKTGYCYGCGRTNAEKQKWKLEETLEEWKLENIITIKKKTNRMAIKKVSKSPIHIKLKMVSLLFKKKFKNE